MAKQKKHSKILLEPNLDVAHASGLLEQAREWQANNGPLALNTSDVVRVGTSAIQILLALCTERKDAGLKTTIAPTGDIFAIAVHDLGLTDNFKEFMHE